MSMGKYEGMHPKHVIRQNSVAARTYLERVILEHSALSRKVQLLRVLGVLRQQLQRERLSILTLRKKY